MTHKPIEMPTGEVPPLTTGMRMDRETFHRVYCLHPEIKKAELIGGVVYVASPLTGFHADPHDDLFEWIRAWSRATPGTHSNSNRTLMLFDGQECQPDIVLFVKPLHGGKVVSTPEMYLAGTPELVVEVAVTTVVLDTGSRKESYRRTGVREYIICRPMARAIDWYVLREGEYELLPPDSDGVVRSEVFSGLWLNVPALLGEDMDAVLDTLRTGLAWRAEAPSGEPK